MNYKLTPNDIRLIYQQKKIPHQAIIMVKNGDLRLFKIYLKHKLNIRNLAIIRFTDFCYCIIALRKLSQLREIKKIMLPRISTIGNIMNYQEKKMVNYLVRHYNKRKLIT